MEQSLSWKVNSCSAVREIPPPLLWNQKVHYHVLYDFLISHANLEGVKMEMQEKMKTIAGSIFSTQVNPPPPQHESRNIGLFIKNCYILYCKC
jgi:hypothetical protein